MGLWDQILVKILDKDLSHPTTSMLDTGRAFEFFGLSEWLQIHIVVFQIGLAFWAFGCVRRVIEHSILKSSERRPRGENVWGSYVSRSNKFRTKIGSNRSVWRLFGPRVHFYINFGVCGLVLGWPAGG